MNLAKENGCQSVAFPLISSGIYGYPKDQALKVAVDTISEFLLENEMMVYIVIFDRKTYQISGKLFDDIAVYIDDRYVEEHLDDPNLTLKWIAENYLFMNVDYVSKRFIKETGQKFSAYLTALRIQKAKQLLADGHSEQIQWVAQQVGCGNNPQYFSQIFKKSTGLTPSAYAKKLNGGE